MSLLEYIKEIDPQLRRSFISILVIVFIIPVTLFLVKQSQDNRQYAAGVEGVHTANTDDSLGYIVQFNTDLDVVDLPRAKSTTKLNLSSNINNQKSKISNEHQMAKQDILNKIGKKTFDKGKKNKGDKKVLLISEYINSFNGIAINADDADITKIKTSPFVKAIYPNKKLKISLMDSVPLIGADKIWTGFRDSQGIPITGKGVNVAVLDTGVDYTHDDLGKSILNERPLEKITNKPFINYSNYDSTFSFNKNRIVYISGNDTVSIYDFSTKTTKDIKLNTTGLNNPTLYNVFLAGNNLFYISYANTGANLYYKNLSTGVSRKVSDLGSINQKSGVDNTHLISVISRGSFSNGKYYYERQTGTLNSQRTTLQNVYSYDISQNKETKILGDSIHLRYPKVFGTKMVYAHYSPTTFAYDKFVVRDLTTNVQKDIVFSGAGPVIDFKNNLILSKSYGSFGTYNLYDLNTGINKELSYSQISPLSTQSEDSLILGYDLAKGLIGDGVIFMQKNNSKHQIVAYDLNTNKYSLINLKNFSGGVGGEGKKICFASVFDSQIYCHNYNSSGDYSIPSNLYNLKVKGGYNVLDTNEDALDDNGHGTHVAGIIAGNGVVKGVAPDANIYSYKVMNSDGGGYMSDIINGIDKAIQTRLDTDPANDINVMNISLGASCFGIYTSDCGPTDPLSTAVDNAVDSGIFVAVAAGNEGGTNYLIATPGTASKAMTVGAVDKAKKIAPFSSTGPVIFNNVNYGKPDVVAPGVSICSAEMFSLVFINSKCLDSSHVVLSGTSMATPHVVGLAALVLQLHPDWTPQQVKDVIKNNSDNLGYDVNIQGAGMIDATKLFDSIDKPTLSPTITPSISPILSITPTPTAGTSPTSSPINKTLKIITNNDAYVRQDTPNKNYGFNQGLYVDSTVKAISYLGFDLSPLRSKKISKVILVLNVSNSPDADSRSIQILKLSSSFSESTINYNNRPKLLSSISSINGGNKGQEITIDVTNAIVDKAGDSIYFGIETTGADGIIYYSREFSSGRPYLLVEYQ